MPTLDLSRNRAEELGETPWDWFVIPPYFDKLDLKTASKSRIIVGGRGCGKTMLLTYFSHNSQFSTNRKNITMNAVEHIGLYWRADRNYSQSMKGRGKEQDFWIDVFEHHLAITYCKEIFQALINIAQSTCPAITQDELETINLSKLKIYHPEFPGKIEDAAEFMEELSWELDAWLKNIHRFEKPVLFPGSNFLMKVIQVIRQSSSNLATANFYAYVDEYENLQVYQQEIINGGIKFSKRPLIFHMATKRNGLVHRRATQNDFIVDHHDYVQFDLEEIINDDSNVENSAHAYRLFAGEVFLNELFIQKYSLKPELLKYFKSGILVDESRLVERKENDYRKLILDTVTSLIPQLSNQELAENALENKTICKKVSSRIQKELEKYDGLKEFNSIWDVNHPRAMIILPAILSRRKYSLMLIKDELAKYQNKENSQFKNWIHVNFIGCFIGLYHTGYGRCPIYSGFSRFCTMSAGNLRHLLELISKSAALQMRECEQSTPFPVKVENQIRAAGQASEKLLSEIRSFSDEGYKMYSFVQRLGKIFKLSHTRIEQSEPETTHFALRFDDTVSVEVTSLLNELTKFSILIKREATKEKDNENATFNHEYQLNPIYAPKFGISYRRIRCLTISNRDIVTLVSGSEKEYEDLRERFKKKWNVDLKEKQHSLFSE